jgi:hypothetical protein
MHAKGNYCVNGRSIGAASTRPAEIFIELTIAKHNAIARGLGSLRTRIEYGKLKTL